MTAWSLVYDTFDPKQEGLREALCTLANGYFATRGAAPESEADAVHYPGTYLAGGYNRLQTEIAGRTIENEDLVNMPNWLVLTFRPEGGDWLNLLSVEILSFRQELDLKTGILCRTMRFKDRQNRETSLVQRRFVHMKEMHLAGLETTITPENWSGRMEVRSVIDGTVINGGVDRYRQLNSKHLVPVRGEAVNDETVCLLVATTQSNLRVAEAARTRVFVDGQRVDLQPQLIEQPGCIGQEFSIEAVEGKPVRIEKIVSLCTSRDFAASEPALEAAAAVEHAGGFDELLDSHALQWAHLWQRCEIRLENSDRAQMILRLHIFHLLQTVSRNTMDLDVGVPARGWHGEAYRGHIFWDEIFIFPYLF